MYNVTDYLLGINPNDKFRFADVRTYHFISSQVDYECKYSATQSYIADTLRLSRGQVNRSLNLLQETDFVREQRVNGVKTYFLNPRWRTRGKNHGQLIEIYEAIPPKVSQDLDFMQQCEKIAQNF